MIFNFCLIIIDSFYKEFNLAMISVTVFLLLNRIIRIFKRAHKIKARSYRNISALINLLYPFL